MIAPSKKVLSIVIVVIALVVAIIITFGKDKSSQAINFTNNLVAGEKISIPENPNWQNELNGVAQNTKLVQTENGTSTKETATDTISKSLMSNYLALKESGTLDQTSSQKLVDQTVNLFDQLGDNTVLDTQLNIVADNGEQSIADYGERLGMVLKTNKPQEMLDERKIISDAVGSRDPSKIKELDPVIAVYQNIANDLLRMPVPKTFVRAHLDMTDGVKNIAIALTEIKTVFSDPIKSLQAMQMYKDGVTMFIGAKQATDAFIIKNNIVYKQNSGGYYLLYGI